MTQFWYDMSGNPITRERAEELLSRPDLLTIATSELGHGIKLVTRFTVLDTGDCRIPHLFETSVVGDDDGQVVMNWHTQAEALAGHNALVENSTVIEVDLGAAGC